jgi:hypothetical protein
MVTLRTIHVHEVVRVPYCRAAGTRRRTDCPIWLAYMRLEDPPGLSPITTVGRFATVDEAQVATDEVRASRDG